MDQDVAPESPQDDLLLSSAWSHRQLGTLMFRRWGRQRHLSISAQHPWCPVSPMKGPPDLRWP
eukprot:9007335-Alexandrium_andersonii.AAC.1